MQVKPIDSEEHILRDFYQQRRPREVKKRNKSDVGAVKKSGKVESEKGVSDVIMQSLLAFKPNAVPNTKVCCVVVIVFNVFYNKNNYFIIFTRNFYL